MLPNIVKPLTSSSGTTSSPITRIEQFACRVWTRGRAFVITSTVGALRFRP